MTMENRYQRNRLYVSEEEQARMKHTPILISGAGVGSIIAECALRFGFESLTIVDGDIVEESNLNRQNYTTDDLGRPKAEALCMRLLLMPWILRTRHHSCLMRFVQKEAFPYFTLITLDGPVS